MTGRPVPSLIRRLLGVPEGCGTRFFLLYRLGRLAGINRRVPWPVHFTSQVNHPGKVKLGRATFPGDSPHCYINAYNGIEVGDYCNLAPGVGLISANHNAYDNARWDEAPPIRLGAHCWIGMNAVILPGVALGPHTVVGAGAVVTKSFPEGCRVIAGNPARVIRELDRGRLPAS
ncbi:acyltransferase [Candidatus Poribacteria bacterium]|nr:acyltransferase [Candidatus Poribacteria bacterium]